MSLECYVFAYIIHMILFEVCSRIVAEKAEICSEKNYQYKFMTLRHVLTN